MCLIANSLSKSKKSVQVSTTVRQLILSLASDRILIQTVFRHKITYYFK